MFARSLRTICLLAAVVIAAAPIVHAEEGMWTFDNPPLKQLAAKYNFHPTQAWLDHLRLSSVRLNDGGSGSFVSPNGLLLTNHHVARGQLQKNSTAEHDYLRDGFYAATPDQEMKSPDLEVNVLVGMQDVTARVQGAAKGIADEAKALKARDAEIAAIAKESKDKTGLRSDVVVFYNGGEYWLYQYKAYTDVRLVFAPEQQAAFYGGDPDNFTYPRYDLDMALFRVYDNGKPLHTDNFLKWSAKGAAPGELIFISGHPGSTERQDTMAQLLLERDVSGPAITEYLQRRIAAAQAFAAQGPEQARLVGSTIFGLQNSLKVYLGRARALADKAILAKKQAEEDDFRAKVAANPEWQKAYGSCVGDDRARRGAGQAGDQRSALPPHRQPPLHASRSRSCSMWPRSRSRMASACRSSTKRGLTRCKSSCFRRRPIYPSTEKLFMTDALKLAQEKLGKDDAYVQAILQGGDVDTDGELPGRRHQAGRSGRPQVAA